MDATVLQIIITSIVTGAVTSVGTVAAIKVNINWLIRAAERNEKSINRAHERIDNAERRMSECRLRHQ